MLFQPSCCKRGFVIMLAFAGNLLWMEQPAIATSEPGSPVPARATHLLLEAEGVLEAGDRIAYQDGSLYDEYAIEGTAGLQVLITLESTEFDPFLVVLDAQGNILAQNDDVIPGDRNSALDVVLPDDGTYWVLANGLDRFSRGHYILRVSTPQQRDDGRSPQPAAPPPESNGGD